MKFSAFLKRDFKNDPESFVDSISASLNTFLATDLKKAEKYLKKAEQIAKFLPDSVKPRFLAMEARLAHWSGRPKSALKKYQRSCRLFRKYGNKMAEMRTGIGLMDVHMYLGNYKQALKVGKASLNFFSKTNESILAANTMINLGNVYHRLDKNPLALRYYDRAREIYFGRDKQRLAMAEYNRANIYANLFKLDKAKELYRTASRIYRDLGMEINYWKSEYSLTYLEFLTDNYAVALKQFEKIYDEFIRLGDIKSASVTQLDLVELHSHLNQFGAASMLADELVTQFSKLGMNYEKGKAQYFAAEASTKVGDYSKAAKLLTDAKRTFSKEKNLLWLGVVSNARAKLYLKRNKFAKAEAEVKKALGHFVKSGDKRRTLDARITQIDSRFTNMPTSGLLRNTQKILNGPLASYQRFQLESMLGQHYLEAKTFDEALKYCNSSLSTLKKMLAGLYPDEVRYYFLEDKTAAYAATMDCLLKLERTDESFSQSLQLMSIVNQRQPLKKIKENVSKDLSQKIKHLRANLKSLNITGHLGQRHVESRTAFRKIEHQLWLTEQKLRSSVYSMHQEAIINSEPLRSTIEHLPDGKVLLNYLSIGDRVGVFCADGNKVEYVPLQVRRRELERLVRELDFTMENSIHNTFEQTNFEAANNYLQIISSLLLEPFLPVVGKRGIILLIDGLFAQIPWLALLTNHKNTREIASDFRIICNPLDLKNIGIKPGRFSDRPNAVFAVSSENLPSVETEADKISGYFDRASVHKNKMATTGNLKEALETYDGFIHIAAHSSRSSENPLFSRILMDDGPFFPFDLFNSGVKAQLVTLSGCQTAAPGLYYGNSFSLAKSFMQAGSRFVLASLWPVRDKEIMRFMNHFYANLKVTEDVFESYSLAAAKTKEETQNPAVWSSFVLWGL